MTKPWPGRWHSKAVPETDGDYTNDNGIRWVIGDAQSGEWLKMWGDVPTNHC